MLKVNPEIDQAFMDLYRATFAEGALDSKTKELIALAVSLCTGCEH